MKTKKNILIIVFAILFLVPGIQINAQSKEDLKYFSVRREKLIEQLEGGIALISSVQPGRRAAEFYYLTGYRGNNAFLLINPGADKEFILYVEPSDLNDIKNKTGADEVFHSDKIEGDLKKLLKNVNNVYIRSRDNASRKLIEDNQKKSKDKVKIQNVNSIVNELRVIKDELELKYLFKAIDITCDAQINAYKLIEPGKNECEVQNVIETTFLEGGGQGPGFTTICGSGPNTAILHYSDNNKKMKNGDMIVMDIGCSYNNYTADVTRTVPVNGKFTKEQAEIYKLVLKSQLAAIELIKPGRGVYEGQVKVDEIIKDGLVELGLITDPQAEWQARFYRRHGYSHWIGLVVHDVGSYGRRGAGESRILEPGMILTIEPGIYISEDMLEALDGSRRLSNVPKKELEEFSKRVKPLLKKYMHIGVRIEDDILITKDGNIVVSSKAPKKITDVERVMRKGD